MGMLFQDKLKEYDLRSLRVGITGGSPMPPELFAEFAGDMAMWGLTNARTVPVKARLSERFPF